MIYDELLRKGVRKKILKEPNPTKVELSKTCTLQQLYTKAEELFFSDIEGIEDLKLGDSSGSPIILSDEHSWSLGDYFLGHHLQPSRHKLYVIAKVKVRYQFFSYLLFV